MLHDDGLANEHKNDLLRVQEELEKFCCDELICLMIAIATATVAAINLEQQGFGVSWSFLIFSVASAFFLIVYFRMKKRPRFLADKEFAKENFPAIIVNDQEIEILKSEVDGKILPVKVCQGGYSIKPLQKTDAIVYRGTLEDPGMKILRGPFWEIFLPSEEKKSLILRDITLKTYVNSGSVTLIQ